MKFNFKVFLIVLIMFLIISFPSISKNAVLKGLVISANILIPSLFPFMVCVLMITRTEIYISNKFVNKILYNLFGQNFKLFLVFILSMLGGYPIGASLINEMYCQKTINNKTADIMLTYCVNAGPAFIINIVGGNFALKKIGIILLVSHILASITICIFFTKKLKRENVNIKIYKNKNLSFSQNLTKSISDTSNNLIKICSFVMFFSVINSFIDYLSINLPIIRYITYFTEVTNAVTSCKNIYFISFILGFSGFSIWCQVFSISEKRKINIVKFAVARIAHGIISIFYLYIIINVFKIKISTFNNNSNFTYKLFYTSDTLFIAMIIMIIVFLISIFTKNYSRKIINDML